MTKTCYFCEHEIKCGVPYPYFKLITEDVCKARHLTNRFKPTDEWLYIERLEKENEELKKLKDITKSFAERCRIIFTQSENIPPSIRSEYLKHTQYEYDEIKRVIDIIEMDEVKE